MSQANENRNSESPLTVYAVADPKYELFIPLFISSVLQHNVLADCIVGVSDLPAAKRRHSESLALLKEFYPSRFSLRQVDFSLSKVANSIRFLDFPPFESDYVYFSDIDFLVVEDITLQNSGPMEKSGLPFNNIVRTGTKRLTGLHFTLSSAIWSPPISGREIDFDIERGNDEELLFSLVQRDISTDLRYLRGATRPIPGLHVSLFSRFPFGTVNPLTGSAWVGWGGANPEKVLTFLSSDFVRKLEAQSRPEAQIPFSLARTWALASVASQRGSFEPDLIPTFTGKVALMRRAAERA